MTAACAESDVRSTADAVAVVGLACLFPGAATPSQFWRNLVQGVDSITDAPPDWRTECGAHATEEVYTRRGGFLGDLSRFQPSRYGVMPSAIEGAEPDQFLALRVAAEALADAGCPAIPLNREKTGVILGRGFFVNRGSLSWMLHGYALDEFLDLLGRIDGQRFTLEERERLRTELKRQLPALTAETVSGVTHCLLTGRIANRLDLHGPTYTLDAACSSVLVAVEHGMRELRSGRCDAVIVGGVQISTPPLIHQLFCRIEAVSRKGVIAPFGSAASGTLLSEGCGMLVLKRPADAQRDGNRIYALLRAVGVSSDGKGAGLLAPQTAGQQLAMRRAYDEAGILPSTLGMIEAHGTGIPLGDRTELQSLAAIFGARDPAGATIPIGSVKSNVGHMIPASGVASLIKTVLALHHRVIPATLHAEEPHPSLGLEATPFYLASHTRPWVHGDLATPRRAGVNAFGFGGINAHAILEEFPGDESELERLDGDWPFELIVVSAESDAALRARTQALADWCRTAESVRLLDIAAACADESGPSRLAIVARDRSDLVGKLEHAVKLLAEPGRTKIQDRSGIFWHQSPLGCSGRLAFVFPGEGSQYPNMLAELCRLLPEVRRAFDFTDAGLRLAGLPLLSPLLFPAPERANQAESELLQLEGGVASVLAAQRALLAVLDRLEIRADAYLGHSSGEFGALRAAGCYPAVPDERELAAVIARDAATAARLARDQLAPPAALLAVGGARRAIVEEVLARQASRLRIAMDNCPNQIVLSGDEATVAQAREELRGAGGLCELLPWGRAYHTPAFAPAARALGDYFRDSHLNAPARELWSCATADRFPNDGAETLDLAIRQWHEPVRFRETILAMYAAGVRLFVEVGPRGNLANFISDTLGRQPHLAVALDDNRRPGIEQLCRALAQLAAHGVPMALTRLYHRRRPVPINLTGTPPASPPADPPLEQGLPRLQVGEAFRLSTANPIPEPVSVPSKTDAPPAELPRTISTSNEVPGVAWAKRDGGSIKAAGSPHAPALAEFQKTMRLFLQIQERVASARFGARTLHESPPTPAAISSPQPPPEVSESTVPSAVIAVAPVAAPETIGRERLQKRLRDIVAARTGYPAEALSPDAQLEADLGIDSIKRVEVLTAFAEEFGLNGRRGLLLERLAGARTLDDIAATTADVLAELPDAKMPPASVDSTPVLAADASVIQMPLLDAIIAHEPGKRLVAECRLDPTRHRFLRDHAFFGRALSLDDPELLALPVMPFAMTLELMAEAAATLAPGKSIAALRDARTFRWLAVHPAPRIVRVEAAIEPDGAVRTAVLDPHQNDGLIAQAIVEWQTGTATLGPARVPDRATREFGWSQDTVYGRILFHGPAFQGIARIDACEPDASRATLREPPTGLLLDPRDEERLVLPPSLIDQTGQLVGVAVVRHTATDEEIFLTYPNGFDRLEYCAGLARAQPLRAVATLERSGTQVDSDVEILDATGRVVLRSLGRIDEQVRMPADFYAYWSDPAHRRLAEIVPMCDERYTVCSALKAGDRFLIRGIWTEVLAHMVLGRREREEFQNLKLPPVTAASWLLGRIATKEALRARLGLAIPLADVKLAEAASTYWIRSVHRGFGAAAIVADRSTCAGLGIAIEPLDAAGGAIDWALAESVACSAAAQAGGLDVAVCRATRIDAGEQCIEVSAAGRIHSVAVRRVGSHIIAVCQSPLSSARREEAFA